MRDRIVLVIRDKVVRKKLLQTEKQDLESILKIATTSEAANEHLRVIEKKDNQEDTRRDVDAVRKRNSKAKVPEEKGQDWTCWKCELKHKPRQCPAFGKSCHSCGSQNHFATSRQCKKKKQLNS